MAPEPGDRVIFCRVLLPADLSVPLSLALGLGLPPLFRAGGESPPLPSSRCTKPRVPGNFTSAPNGEGAWIMQSRAQIAAADERDMGAGLSVTNRKAGTRPAA